MPGHLVTSTTSTETQIESLVQAELSSNCSVVATVLNETRPEIGVVQMCRC